MDRLEGIKEVELTFAELTHENRLLELKNEEDIKIENIRHKIKVNGIVERFNEYFQNQQENGIGL